MRNYNRYPKIIDNIIYHFYTRLVNIVVNLCTCFVFGEINQNVFGVIIF